MDLGEVLARYPLGPILDSADWGGTAGRTFRLATADGVFFLRRRGPRSSAPERIRFDHGLRRALLGRGVPTAAPIATRDGADYVSSPEGVYELYPFVEGRAHRPGDRAELASLGATLAAFHVAGAEYRLRADMPPPFEQFSLAAPGTPASGRIDDPACLRAAIEHLARGLAGAELAAARAMLGLAEEVTLRFGARACDELDRYVIHGDLHPANLLFGPDGEVAGVFDLDWASPAPRLRDLADALHFFASAPTAAGSDIWALTAPRRLDPGLARLLLGRYHEALPLEPAELEALRWAWLARWLAMHTDGAYKVPPEERGRFLTSGVVEAARRILAFDPEELLPAAPRSASFRAILRDMETTAGMEAPQYRRELGGGLLVRWSDARDAERIAELSGHVFRRKADEPPNRFVAAWIRDLMSGRHPHIGPGDFAVVEETASGRIVSSACLLSYEVDFEGVRVPFGRPEIVATHPDYRNRGLVRAIFELLHARSAARGHLLQGITGIPYYYRLFGYEYAADLGGQLAVPFAAIPPLEAGATEPYTLRKASLAELPWARELYDRERARYALTASISDRYWRWIAFEQDPASGEGWTTRLVVDSKGSAVGYAATGNIRNGDEIALHALVVQEGTSLAAVLPSVLRALVAAAGEVAPRREGQPAPARVSLVLGREHPVYRLLTDAQCQGVRRVPAYAWYLRVADLKGFLLHVRDPLARRLAASPLAGYTGELRLTFYRSGLRLVFSDGRLQSVEDWREDHAWGPRAQAGFPPLVFLELLFGYRSLAELRESFPDVNANDEARPLLEALFPPRPTWLQPMD